MVLILQAEVVPLHEVHVGAHQVKQDLAWSFLLWKEGEKKKRKPIKAQCNCEPFQIGPGIPLKCLSGIFYAYLQPKKVQENPMCFDTKGSQAQNSPAL